MRESHLSNDVRECNNFGEDNGEDLIKFRCELSCAFELHVSFERKDKFENNNF